MYNERTLVYVVRRLSLILYAFYSSCLYFANVVFFIHVVVVDFLIGFHEPKISKIQTLLYGEVSIPARSALFNCVFFFIYWRCRLRAGAISGTTARGASPTLCGSTRACASSGETDELLGNIPHRGTSRAACRLLASLPLR